MKHGFTAKDSNPWEMGNDRSNPYNCLKFPDYNTERYNPGRVQEIAWMEETELRFQSKAHRVHAAEYQRGESYKKSLSGQQIMIKVCMWRNYQML